jgi:hypothetical protein
MPTKISISIFFFFLLFVKGSFAQDKVKYGSLIKEANAFYKAKEYKLSALKYEEAFVVLENRGMINDRYNAACSWALVPQIDSSFVHLFKIVRNGYYKDYQHITTDTDLTILHTDKRWQEVIDLVKKSKEKEEVNWDRPLIAVLDTIHKEDQQYRQQLRSLEAEYGRDSKEMKAHWKTIQYKDSINLIKVRNILDTRGWLGTDVIGRNGNSTLFLVIQHANFKTQRKYLPMMRKAVKEKKANASSLAMLEDRVALRQGKRQLYGSQIGRDTAGVYYVLPLVKPKQINKRRAKMGLGKLENYINHWDMIWDIKRHKRRIKQLRKEKHRISKD